MWWNTEKMVKRIIPAQRWKVLLIPGSKHMIAAYPVLNSPLLLLISLPRTHDRSVWRHSTQRAFLTDWQWVKSQGKIQPWPFLFYFSLNHHLFLIRVTEGAGVQAITRWEMDIRHTLSLTLGTNLVSNQDDVHVFGQWEYLFFCASSVMSSRSTQPDYFHQHFSVYFRCVLHHYLLNHHQYFWFWSYSISLSVPVPKKLKNK